MSRLRGRFSAPTDPEMDRFSSSIEIDLAMAQDDIDGSRAHAIMLGETGIIPAADAESLVRGLAPLGASCTVASARAEWPGESPAIAFIDLADVNQPVRDVRLAYGHGTELVAIVDNESVERLIPALAAGCGDYLFYPINSDELGLKWRKHIEGEGGTRARRPGGLAGSLQFEFPSSVRFVREVVA